MSTISHRYKGGGRRSSRIKHLPRLAVTTALVQNSGAIEYHYISERSCICVLEVSIVALFYHFNILELFRQCGISMFFILLFEFNWHVYSKINADLQTIYLCYLNMSIFVSLKVRSLYTDFKFMSNQTALL